MSIQFGGVVSGLDTQTIIDQFMAIERRPVVLMTQRQQTYQARYNAWSELESKLNTLLDAAKALKSSSFTGVTSGDKTVVTGTALASATPGTYDVTINWLAQAHKVRSDRQTSTSAALNTLIADFVGGTVTINGRPFAIFATDSLEDIRDNINANTDDLGVKATIVDNHLVITRNDTGATQMTFVDDATVDGGTGQPKNPLQRLGIVQADGTTVKNELVQAQDASLSIDGIPITNDSNTLSGVISGVTLTLTGAGTTTIEVGGNADQVIEAVKSFVNAYNDVVNFISNKTAKSGKMQGDSSLASLMSRLRSQISNEVSGLSTRYSALWQLGVSFIGGATGAKTGTLSLDEAKLKEALAADMAAVAQLFSASTASGDAADGVATRLYSFVKEYTQSGGFIDKIQETLKDRIDDFTDRITAFEERLTVKRKNLVRQFTEMEKTLGLLQSQSQWLSGQLAAMFR